MPAAHPPATKGRIMLVPMLRLTTALADRLHTRDSEAGFSTAELLGNAALGVGALVAIWLVLEQLGLDVVEYIRGQIF